MRGACGSLPRCTASSSTSVPVKTLDIEAVRIEKVVQTVRFKVAALATAADALVARADEVDEAIVRTIRDDLVNVLAQIEGVLR